MKQRCTEKKWKNFIEKFNRMEMLDYLPAEKKARFYDKETGIVYYIDKFSLTQSKFKFIAM